MKSRETSLEELSRLECLSCSSGTGFLRALFIGNENSKEGFSQCGGLFNHRIKVLQGSEEPARCMVNSGNGDPEEQ